MAGTIETKRSGGVGWLLAIWLLTLSLFSFSPPARAQRLATESVVEDQISVSVVDGEVVAFPSTGSSFAIELARGETVLGSQASGLVALLATDRRLLAASPNRREWQSVRYRLGETERSEALVGRRLALASSEERVFGFDAVRSSWVVGSLGPDEPVLQTRLASRVGVFITRRRVIGLSAGGGSFVEERLRVHEQVESATVSGGSVSVTTSARLLVFNGSWAERKRRLGGR